MTVRATEPLPIGLTVVAPLSATVNTAVLLSLATKILPVEVLLLTVRASIAPLVGPVKVEGRCWQY